MGSISTCDYNKIRVRNVLTNQFSIYLPVLDFLNVSLNDSFKKIHDIANTIRKSPYYCNPFSILHSEINALLNLFHYSNPNQQKVTREVNNMPSLATSHPNTKTIIPFNKPRKALLVLCPVSINTRVPNTSLRHAYIVPLITHAIKMLT